MFRPPSLSKMLRSSSRERMDRGRVEASPRRALNLQSLGNRPGASAAAAPNNPNASFRKASASQLPRTGSMEMGASQHGGGPGFDYSQLDAWASFRADGRVPHTAAEADLESAPTIRVGGVGDLDPRADRPASTTAAPASGGWFDTVPSDEEGKSGEKGGHDDQDASDHFVPESSADTHKTGAYIATAAKREAFHAPESLSRPGRAPGGAKGKLQPAAAVVAPEGAGSMFRPPSLTEMFRSQSREKLPDGRRTLNLQSLGGQGARGAPAPAPAPVSAPESSSGLFRPSSVTRLFRPSSRENNTTGTDAPGRRGVNLRPLGGAAAAGGPAMRPLGQTARASASGTVNASSTSTPATGTDTVPPTSQGSFFDNPNAPTGADDGLEEFGSGDSDDDFRLG
jgi:hypothetical protein